MQLGRWTSWALVATLVACGDSEGEAAGGTTGASAAEGETSSASAVTITSGISGANETGSTSDDASTSGSSSAVGTSTSTGPDTDGTDDTGSTTGADTGSTGETEPTSTTGGLVELGPGDLHFIGVNSDLPEGFALVALRDVPAGTELRFSERAWNEDDGVFEAAEGTATLVLDADLQAGTVFEIGVPLLSVSPDIGTITDDETGNWGIAGNGDNLFVYTGSDDEPTFIAGIAFSSPSVWTMNAAGLDGQSSMIPAELSEESGTITTFSDDNLRYSGPRSGQGSVAAYLPLIADTSNYETGNAAYTPLAGDDFVP